MVGGGGTYQLPENIAYDDNLYTTYIKRDLTGYKGGNGGEGRASSYPAFDATNPVWYGGGNGGGGASSGRQQGAAGSAGSPGGILIEEAIYD